MKTAKEMFEEMGFERDFSNYFNLLDMDNVIKYTRENGLVTYSVIFYLKEKQYAAMFNNMHIHGQRLFVDIKLHQAITQQMKELGWLK